MDVNPTKLLQMDEIHLILSKLKKLRSGWGRRRRIVFRLSCCCGLRESEIANVKIGDFTTEGPTPAIIIRKEIAKYKKSRLVPLWWDSGTLEDIQKWKTARIERGASPDDPFIVTSLGRKPSRSQIYRYWKTAIKYLHPERQKQLPCHAGRHTFASQSLAAGRSLVEVQKALGHRSLQVTSVYAHAIPTKARDIFG